MKHFRFDDELEGKDLKYKDKSNRQSIIFHGKSAEFVECNFSLTTIRKAQTLLHASELHHFFQSFDISSFTQNILSGS